MDIITQEAFEEFAQKEFPGKEYHWDYKNGRGYMSIQAGNGKYYAILICSQFWFDNIAYSFKKIKNIILL